MFKSFALRLSGVGAAAVIASAVIASPASAFYVRPCFTYSSPQIAEVTTTNPPSISGRCFPPGDDVQVMYWASNSYWLIDYPANLVASATGLISAPMEYAPRERAAGTEYIQTCDYTTNTLSNELSFALPSAILGPYIPPSPWDTFGCYNAGYYPWL